MTQSKRTLSKDASSVRTNSVGYLIGQTAAKMNDAMNDALEPLGLSKDQFAILMTLTEFQGITQSEIGQRAGLASYSVTRLLDDLAARKLVVRKPHRESRRSFSIFLTPKGKELSPKLFEATSRVNQLVLASLSAKETEALRAMLTKIVNP